MRNTKTHAEMAQVSAEIEKLGQEVRLAHASLVEKQEVLNILIDDYRSWCKTEMTKHERVYL